MSAASLLIRFRWLLLGSMMWAGPVYGQVVQTARLEINIKNDRSDRYKAVALGEEGVILHRLVIARPDNQIELIKLDTALHEDWKGNIVIDRNLELLRVQHHAEHLYLFLRARNAVGGDFVIVEVANSSGKYTVHAIRNLIPFNPSEFVVTNQAVLIAGYFNYRPLVIYYSLQTRAARVLPGFFDAPGEINQVKAHEDGSVDVVVCSKNPEKRKSLWIRNFSVGGDLVKTTILEPEEGKHLLFGRSVMLKNGQQIVAGVYGRFTDYSRGIFVASISDMGEYSIVYHNFAQLENFFSYMKAGQQKRVKQRIERKTIKGKKIKFNYRFLIQDLIPYKNQYVMTGEAFYPHYIYFNSSYASSRPLTPGYYQNNYSAFPMIRNDMIFDGYQYTHAVVIGFDQNGKLKWDNSFEINDIKSMQLEQFVKIKPDTDRIVMMYLFKNAVRSKIIRNAEVLEGKAVDPIKNTFGEEKVDIPSIESERLDYWYGNYFFAYGVQKLQRSELASRRVFFISKITYR